MESSVVGNKDVFAIEWAVNEVGEKNCIGNFCFWVGGQQVGEFENDSWLNPSIFYLKDFYQHKQLRTYDNSVTVSKEQLFFSLYEKFFTSEAKESGEYLNMGMLRSIFWLDDIGDASFRDLVSIILIDEPSMNRQRIIWRELDKDQNLNEWFLPLNNFEIVSNQYLDSISLLCGNNFRP